MRKRKRLVLGALVAILVGGLGALTPLMADADAGCANADGDSGGRVCVRSAPNPEGNAQTIRDLLGKSGVPQSVIDSRLTEGPLAHHMAGLPALRDTAASLAERPATYTGQGTVVTQSNLESLRGQIAGSGGTFIFRGTITIDQLNKRIEIGSNTTIWIDGTVYYRGPAPAKRGGDRYSIADSIEGLLEVTSGKKSNIRIFGTKRSNLITDGKLKGVNINGTNNFEVRGINFTRTRNSMYAGSSQNGVFEGNFVLDSSRRGGWLKNTNNVDFTNNLIVGSEVDGIDIDAFAKNAEVKGNVVGHNGDRWMIWTEIAVQNILVDGNIGYFMEDRLNGSLGFQENGSETTQPATQNNTYSNNHIFYSDRNTYNRGFMMNSSRRILRDTITFRTNYVWQSVSTKLRYEDPKPGLVDDVIFHLAPDGNQPVPAKGPEPQAPPKNGQIGGDSGSGSGGNGGGGSGAITCWTEAADRATATDEFATRCGGTPVDCDPTTSGRQVCADGWMGAGVADTLANQSSPQGSNPSNSGRCTADGASLSDARSAYQQSCSATRIDCDPIGGGRWRCASYRMG